MSAILWSDCFPDQSVLLRRNLYKNSGAFVLVAPALTTHVRVGLTAVGGQGAATGGNAASARRKALAVPSEVFQLQVGTPGTAMSLGDSWFRRAATGEMLCYADRGRGSGGIQGQAANCIGDMAWSGVAGVGAGSDFGELPRLGLTGRPASATRAPGPGGGGVGVPPDGGGLTRFPAGQGFVIVEFYAGDPGLGY